MFDRKLYLFHIDHKKNNYGFLDFGKPRVVLVSDSYSMNYFSVYFNVYFCLNGFLLSSCMPL